MTVEMEMDGTDVRARRLPPLAHPQRRAPDLRRGRRDLRRPRPRRGALGGRRSTPRARWPRARARSASRARGRQRPSRRFDFDADGHVTRRAPRGPDRVAPPDRAADDPGQRAGGRLPGRPHAADALPRARAPRARRGRVPGRAAREPRRPDAAGARAHDARSRRPTWRRRRRASWRARPRAAARSGSLVLRSLKQAYYTPRNLGHAGLAARATATSPRRSGATRTWSRTARCCRGSASTTPPRAAARARRGGRCTRSAAERDGDADRARRRRRLPRLPARAPPGRATADAGLRGRGRRA